MLSSLGKVEPKRLGRLAAPTIGGVARSYTYDQHGNLLSRGGEQIATDPATNRVSGADYSAWGTLEALAQPGGWTRHTEHDLTGVLTAVWGTGGGKTPPPEDSYAFVTGPNGDRVAVIRVADGPWEVTEVNWEARDLDGNERAAYAWTAATGWQVEAEWLYLGREPVLRYEGGVAYALARDHLGSVRAEARADEKGQPVIHRAGYREMGTLLNSDAVELRSRPKPRPPSAATG